ncbi:MAG: GNAT family N-acetyltransferase [Betaproteobacteria bacterium]|nr:GNAT family N-acetyltransferase [Betaproteobacteria bacterium]MDH3435768.1 GNAT family N-acetyltransferase [Betaproteobacteria bacterium]
MAPVTQKPRFTVKPAIWATDAGTLCAIRMKVFVEEQHVPLALEWDGEDERCEHALVYVPDQTPVGTGRLLPDGRIGRLAVLRDWRRQGAGSALLEYFLQLARQKGFAMVKLHAQTRAMAFYARHGFEAHGEEFMDAGIPHVEMSRSFLDRT